MCASTCVYIYTHACLPCAKKFDSWMPKSFHHHRRVASADLIPGTFFKLHSTNWKIEFLIEFWVHTSMRCHRVRTTTSYFERFALILSRRRRSSAMHHMHADKGQTIEFFAVAFYWQFDCASNNARANAGLVCHCTLNVCGCDLQFAPKQFAAARGAASQAIYTSKYYYVCYTMNNR